MDAVKLLCSPTSKCVYFALLLVLVIYVLWCVYKKNELFGDKTYVYDSGIRQARTDQEFSQPTQGNYTTTHIDAVEAMPLRKIYTSLGAEETLVNTRGEPDFWEVGNVLAAYRGRSDVATVKDRAEKKAVTEARKERLQAEKEAEDAGRAAVKAAKDAENAMRVANNKSKFAQQVRDQEDIKLLNVGLTNYSVDTTFDEDDLAKNVWV